MRRILVALLLSLLGSALLSAYTIVLKDGRKIEARERYAVEGTKVRFTGADGKTQTLTLSQVDVAATETANQPPSRPRIWTNDEIELLRSGRLPGTRGGLNAFGAAPAAPSEDEEGEAEATEENKALPPKETTAEYWREKIQPLRAEIANIDQEIASLRKGQSKASSNTISVNSSSSGVDVQDSIRRLEQRKASLQQQIEGLELEAKRNGVSPGELR